MAIKFRYDAASVTPPSNQSTRKYGQQLVQQEQQRKYNAQQQGYDRLFTLGRDAQQNQFQLGRDSVQNLVQFGRDAQQNAFQTARDKARFDQQQQQQQQQQRAADFAAARTRIDTHARTMLANGEIQDPQARQKIQNLIAGKTIVMGSDFDETARQNYLDQYNAELAKILSEVPPPPSKPTSQDIYDQGIAIDEVTGQRMRPDVKGVYQPIAQQQQRPMSAAEAFKTDPKTRKQYVDDAIRELQKDDGSVVDRKEANARAMELYEIDQQSFNPQPTPVPTLPGTASASPGTMQSILEQTQPAGISPTSPLGQLRDTLGMNQAAPVVTAQMPDARQPPSPSALTAQLPSQGQPPSPMAATPQQQVKVGGKPLAVTPGTLTPQETEARGQVMAMPREQRIAALMPYDPQLKGQTLEQILKDPASKSQYDELTKQGLTTGNYREDMLAQLDDMLQHNVLNGAGRSKPDAYVGMRADAITDPKVKAEVEKLPRPKSAGDRNTIRSGQLYVDPDGIIRTRA